MHSQPPRNEIEVSLISDVQLRQYQGVYNSGTCHPLMYPEVLGSGTKYHRAETTGGGQGQLTTLPLKKARETKIYS